MRKKNSIAQGTCLDDGCHLPIDKYQFDIYIYKYARVMPLKQEQMQIYIYITTQKMKCKRKWNVKSLSLLLHLPNIHAVTWADKQK